MLLSTMALLVITLPENKLITTLIVCRVANTSNIGDLAFSLGYIGHSADGGTGSRVVTASTSFDFDGSTVSAVPVPAAAWLFGSALAGLTVIRRRK